ncbi:MAG: ABC transporter permease [Thermofilaceae archaeon]|nr:ABC transporter permease [Thermofilaceae archaeon]
MAELASRVLNRTNYLVKLITYNRKLTVGVGVLVTLIILGLIEPFVNEFRLGDRSPDEIGLGGPYEPPSSKFPLGTCPWGRDIFGMLLLGLRLTMIIGFLSGALATLVAVLLGFISAYKGGLVDHFLRSFIDAFLVIPTWPIFVIIAAYVKLLGIIEISLLLAAFGWGGAARIIRAQVLSLKERGFINLAKISGMQDIEIIILEMLPNFAPYIIISFTNAVMGAIFAETGLRLIGLGPPLLPTLGYLLNLTLFGGFLTIRPYIVAIVSTVLILVFLSLNLINIGLEEEFNPRLKRVTGL